MRSTRYRAGLAIIACALMLTACSGGDDAPASDGASPTDTASRTFPTGFVNTQDDPGEPVEGGTLTYALTVEADSLDPATEFGAGSAGGSELAAIYDLLVRYDVETGEYVPQLAESLEPNEDYSEWTVTLRDGVTFTDGTPLDAEAVKFSIERYIAAGGGWSGLLEDSLDSISADDMTVVFSLSRPWADFPFLLAQAPGNIVSPAAAEEHGDEFLRNPVGAGPFMLEDWAPGEEILLAANPDYWDGKPHLDNLRFIATQTPQALGDQINAGGADVGFLGDTPVIRDMLEQSYGGYVSISNTGSILLINNGRGEQSRPGEDPRVRQAVAHAIDANAIDQRANAGEGLPGTEVFQQTSQWANDVAVPEYDPDEATRLLEEAKTEGYDGTINIVYHPASPETALSVEALLNAAGFEATAEPVRTVQDLIRRVLVDGDFDLAVYGWSAGDSPGEVFTRYYDRLGREGNSIGYESPEMRQLLLDYAATGDQAEKEQLMASLQEVWTETVPAVPLAAQPQMMVWQENVHGIRPSAQLVLLFDKAWIAP